MHAEDQVTTSDQPGWRPKRPNVTLDDALSLWDALNDKERRYVFTNYWEALEAVHAGDLDPIRRMAESWPLTVHLHKLDPGLRARIREIEALGPVPAHELVNVDDVIRMLRS